MARFCTHLPDEKEDGAHFPSWLALRPLVRPRGLCCYRLRRSWRRPVGKQLTHKKPGEVSLTPPKPAPTPGLYIIPQKRFETPPGRADTAPVSAFIKPRG